MSRPVRREARALLALAAPLIAGHLGNQLMGFVDTAMVGRLGAAAVGGVGVGNGIFFTLSIVAMGCALGMDPLVTQAIGAGEHGHARRIYWQGVRVAVAASVPIMVVIMLAPAILPVIGVEPEVTENARAYLWGRVWNAVPIALFGASRCYLQAVGVTRAIVISTIVANVVNFILNAFLIFGDRSLETVGLPGIGLPALGAFGAGLASSLSGLVSMWILFAAVSKVPAPADPERRRRRPEIERKVVALGLPIGLHMLVEVSAFAAASILSGRISVAAAAANQIALTLASTSFMMPLGVSAATAVRVGQAVGRRDAPGVRLAGLVGLGTGVAIMTISALAFLLVPEVLARILTNKPDVIAASLPLIQIAAVFQLFDGLQVVGAGALRGVGDTRSTLYANVFGHFVVGLPLAVFLAFQLELGGPGLWWGLSAGLALVGVILLARFLRTSRAPIARAG